MNRLTWFFIFIVIVLLYLIISYTNNKNKNIVTISIPKVEQKCKYIDINNLSVIESTIKFKVHTIPYVLTRKQCENIRNDALLYLKPSKVYNVPDKYQDLIRSSTSCTILNEDTLLIQSIASKLSGYPIDNIEPVQIVRYEEGQGFSEHYDTDKDSISSTRVATFMIYLNEGFIGGETEFTQIKKLITPEIGMGVFWWNTSGGELIQESKHKGRYIISGTKWIINTWVHSIAINEIK